MNKIIKTIKQSGLWWTFKDYFYQFILWLSLYPLRIRVYTPHRLMKEVLKSHTLSHFELVMMNFLEIEYYNRRGL